MQNQQVILSPGRSGFVFAVFVPPDSSAVTCLLTVSEVFAVSPAAQSVSASGRKNGQGQRSNSHRQVRKRWEGGGVRAFPAAKRPDVALAAQQHLPLLREGELFYTGAFTDQINSSYQVRCKAASSTPWGE